MTKTKMAASSGSKRNKCGELEFWKSSLPLVGSQWKCYTFEIVRGVYFLRHKRHHLLHQPEEQVLLSEITEVEPHPQEERAFVVRFSGARLPWTLRAKSKEERKEWMEALLPGSYQRWQNRQSAPHQMLSEPPAADNTPPPYNPEMMHQPNSLYPQLPEK